MSKKTKLKDEFKIGNGIKFHQINVATQGRLEKILIFSRGSKRNLQPFDLQKNLVKVANSLEQNLSFSFRLINQKKNKICQIIRLKYAIYFLMKNGKYSKKIF